MSKMYLNFISRYFDLVPRLPVLLFFFFFSVPASDSHYAIYATWFRGNVYNLMPEETLTDVKYYICLAPT